MAVGVLVGFDGLAGSTPKRCRVCGMMMIIYRYPDVEVSVLKLGSVLICPSRWKFEFPEPIWESRLRSSVRVSRPFLVASCYLQKTNSFFSVLSHFQ